jgi:hypothetical protein
MYNLRYHIASLVAVFLALATGLILGTVVGERGFMDKQQTTLVKSLQTEFTSLSKANADLKRERDRDHAFSTDAVPILIGGTMKGKNILLITNAGRNDAAARTRDVLRQAGADTVVVTLKAKDLGMDDPNVQRSVSGIVTLTPGAAGASDPVAGMLAAEWAKGGTQPLTDALRTSGQLTVDGAWASAHFDGVVLLASFDGAADAELVSVAADMQKSGMPAVGVESQTVATGVSDAALGAGLSSVDNVDSPEGGLSLVYVLLGKAEGHFGVDAGATAAYPKLR